MDFEILKQLGVALGLSALIGLEREQKHQHYNHNDSFGGIRTFALAGILGALSYILYSYSVVIFASIVAGFIAMLVTSYVISAKQAGKLGLTSELASILTFIIGILAATGQFVMAATVTLITLAVLHFKEPLHYLAGQMENRELVSTIQFFAISFVVLPLLPNQSFGPYGFFNPYLVWLMVVFISAISFLSYIAVKILGAKKGIGLTGFFAGFISSTALALSFSAQSKKKQNIVNPYALAVVVASSAMFFRVLIEVFVVNPDLLKSVFLPILVMGVTGIISAVVLYLRKENTEMLNEKIEELENPSGIVSAIKFGLVFASILFVAKFAQDFFGDKGIYITSFVSGLLDVDAITISIATLAKDTISSETATIAIFIASVTNTMVKALIFLMFGSRKAAMKILKTFVIIILAGLSSLTFLFLA